MKPKKVTIKLVDGEVIELKDVMIGIYDKKIGKKYSALIGLETME